MSIVNWFSNNLDTEERELTRDLISMAIADGEFTEAERQEILRACEIEGISNAAFMDTLRGKDIHIPKTEEEQRNYMTHLIRVMNADDFCSPMEIHTLEVLANHVGYRPMDIVSIILDEITNQRLTKDEGLDLLNSYVKTTLLLE